MAGTLSRAEYIDLPVGCVKRALGVHIETLSGNITLDETYPNLCKFDPAGARDVTLDTEATAVGLVREIVNAADAAEAITVKDAATDTIGTISQNEKARFYCDGTDWVLIDITTIALS